MNFVFVDNSVPLISLSGTDIIIIWWVNIYKQSVSSMFNIFKCK